MRVETVTHPIAEHGEGPVWLPDEGRLRWVDMLAGEVLATDPATGHTERLKIGEVAACVRPRRGGGLVFARERGFALLDPDSTEPRALPEVWSDPSVRMNDGSCDHLGRFYCGSMDYGAAPERGALYRLDPDLTVTTVLEDVTISNGLAWTREGTRAYYIDTPTQRVDVFDVDRESGELGERRVFVEIPADQGNPDGLCLDADGGVWVAMWDGHAVHRYSPAGTLDRVIELPVQRPTACSFGGPDLTELYITTSRLDVDTERHPDSGALLRIRPGHRGIAPLDFAG